MNGNRRWSRAQILGTLGLAPILVVTACTSATVGQSGGSAPPTIGAGGAKPNILFVLTDDMRFDDLQFMPNVKKVLVDQGMSFQNEFDNVTLCCPARTTILRGQYSHNSGVLTNGGDNGGFETAYQLGIEKATVATALHDVGYRTGLFGKYLNGYPNTASDTYVPPGWDTWSSSVKGDAYGEFNYTLNENGKKVDYGNTSEDYGTDVYMRQTKAFMTQAGKDGKPFFGYVGVYAPHGPATPAPRHKDLFNDAKAPRDPAFNEEDVSDKPQFIQDQPILTDPQINKIDASYRQRARSLQAVDEGIAGLVDTLQQTGQLANTYIVFTSDNGFHLGQHRMPSGKRTAYETDIHLPLVVRGPNVAAGSKTEAITGNTDFAPTFAALGGTKLADDPDGRSLVPLLHGERPTDWRQAFLLEHWTDKSSANPGDGTDGPQLEPGDADQEGTNAAAFAIPEQKKGTTSTTTASTSSTTTITARERPSGSTRPSAPGTPGPNGGGKPRVPSSAKSGIPEFQGLRVDGYTYVEYATGEKELYDLNQDPDQLDNIVTSADPALVEALHQRLEELRACTGDSCRSAESKPLP